MVAAHQSEHALAASLVPSLNPATLDEIIDYGLLGWAMSRFTGLWIGLKLVTDLVDSSGVVQIDPERARAAALRLSVGLLVALLLLTTANDLHGLLGAAPPQRP